MHTHVSEGLYLTAAMHMAALSHREPESDGTSHDSCSAQDCHTRNTLCDVHFYIHDHSTYTGGGWCHSYNISSATDSTRALIPLWGIPHFNITQVIFCNRMGNVTASVSSTNITYTLGLIPKFDTFVSVSKLSCSNKGIDKM